MDAERLFLESLPRIEAIVRSICRRQGWHGDDAEEFSAHVKLKLIEDDYARLRKFRDQAKLSTYLTTCVQNLFRDFRIARWGKWRPSAAARDLGVAAVELEILIHRDGRSVDEAVAHVSRHGTVRLAPRRLYELAELLPVRGSRSHEDDGALASLPAVEQSDERLDTIDRRSTASRLGRALQATLRELDEEDRAILKMHFWDGFTVRRIADTLHLPQRPLYRRVERVLRDLRGGLSAAGLDGGDVDRIVGRVEGMQVRLGDSVFSAEKNENSAPGPSSREGRDL